MNDSQEWLYSLELVRLDLAKRINSRKERHWSAFISELSQALSRIEGLNICVFSLSAMRNQLSQWRGYCPADGGYNLGFKSDLLLDQLTEHGFRLQQCIYDRAKHNTIINAVVSNALVSVGQLENELAEVAPILKHPDFKEEQEWRAFSVVPSNDPRMACHTKGPIVVPHCRLSLDAKESGFPLTHIVSVLRFIKNWPCAAYKPCSRTPKYMQLALKNQRPRFACSRSVFYGRIA